MKHQNHLVLFVLALCCLLSACDKGDPNKDADRDLSIKEGNARATGGACRHAGRALEDCYILNPESDRASVFAGWKDMNDYMRDNKMEDVKPLLEKPKPASNSVDSKKKSTSRGDGG
jgi:hypothetical protein